MAPGTSALKSKCPKCAKPWTASPSGSWDRGSPLENSLLLGQHSSCTLCLLASRLSQGRGPCGVRLSWQSPLQLPICSSFALQGPRKTALRNQEKWEGQCLGRSLPARLLPAPFNPVSPIPGSSSQLLRAFFSKTTYFLSLACGHGKTQ